MSVRALEYLKGRMDALGIPYAFVRWNDPVPPEYYFVAEYTEIETPTRQENGMQETSIILRGFTRGSWLLLEEAKAAIEAGISTTAILADGTGIAVMYDYGMVVPTGDAELKSIKINLTIREWMVN